MDHQIMRAGIERERVGILGQRGTGQHIGPEIRHPGDNGGFGKFFINDRQPIMDLVAAVSCRNSAGARAARARLRQRAWRSVSWGGVVMARKYT